MNSPNDIPIYDIIKEAIDKMQQALDRKDQKAFEEAREEVIELFYKFGYTKS